MGNKLDHKIISKINFKLKKINIQLINLNLNT